MDPPFLAVSGGKYPDIEKWNPVKWKLYTLEETCALSNNILGIFLFLFFLGVRRYFPGWPWDQSRYDGTLPGQPCCDSLISITKQLAQVARARGRASNSWYKCPHSGYADSTKYM